MRALLQQPLFDESKLPKGHELLLPPEEQARRFTGEMVRRNAERYEAIVSALGEGLGIRQICRAFKVSQHTVEGIRERDAGLIATDKERTGRQLRRIVRMTLGRIEEALEKDEISPGQLPVTAGILIDKSLNWDGQATAIVRHEHGIDQAKVLAMFRALATPPGEVVDVEIAPAPEFESGVKADEQQQKGIEERPSGGDVVESTAPAGAVGQGAGLPGGGPADLGARAGTGGGGIEAAPPDSDPDASGAGKFEPKA